MELDTVESLTQSRLEVKISRKDKSVESLAEDVADGLSSTPKTLSPKYFYDKTGSKIFEEICELPEYYPTRSERAILRAYAEEITRFFDKDITLVELGSGNSSKTQLLIRAFIKRFERLHYLPIDISKSILSETAQSLLQKYLHLKITAFVSDYHTALSVLKKENIGDKLILFLGSNIGNFEPQEAEIFLKKTYATMNRNDRLLVGVDLKKAESILIPAYDDSQGVTAKFNFNMLRRINRVLDANFDLSKFRHKIIFNNEHSRIEMHLESMCKQTVAIHTLGQKFHFEKGETIHTENSYKYSLARFNQLAIAAGFEVQKTWFDEKKWFSLNFLRPAPARL
ncbi:MAG: L-histidine N(alpha)-methyltransferase [bacterium]